jgi:hypothetical protein
MDGILRFDGAVELDPAIDVWFGRQRGDLAVLAQEWFERMRRCGDDVRELLHDGCPVACVQDAPFTNVNAFTAHVSVGFFHGAALDDPAGLLKGRGRRMRHVTLHPGHQVATAALTTLINAAYRDIVERLAWDGAD